MCRGEGSKAGKEGKERAKGERECVWRWGYRDEEKKVGESRQKEGERETRAQLVCSPY